MIELHRHLLGSIRPETIWELAVKYHIPEISHSKKKFINLFTITKKVSGLEKYIKPWELIRNLIRTPDDIFRISYECAIDAQKDGISYIEFRNTPTNLFDIISIGPQFKIPTFSYLDSIQKGFAKAYEETGIISKLNLSIQRQLTYSLSKKSKINLAKKYVIIFQKYYDKLVVGIDLTGIEAGNHTKEFNSIFELFQSENIPLTIHTGETENVAEVWDTIRFLKPNRIGHGLAIVNDNDLLNEIKYQNIAIEICPTSNWILSKYKTINEHPLFKYLLHNDLDIIICSDNTTLCDTTLSNEIKICSSALKVSFNKLKQQQSELAKKHCFYKKLGNIL